MIALCTLSIALTCYFTAKLVQGLYDAHCAPIGDLTKLRQIGRSLKTSFLGLVGSIVTYAVIYRVL